jgi:threonine/homoserine/homoserine lactone efflux protein
MVSAFFHGIGFGLLLTIMIGPVFFGLLQTSISKGFKQGMLYALGVALSDVTLIFLTYFGISSLLENHTIKNIVSVVGGLVTLIFGIYYLLKPAIKAVPVTDLPKGKEKSNIIWKGFFLNLLNPSVLFFWIATVSLISVNYEGNSYRIIAFFVGIITALFSADVMKSYIANKIKAYFTDKVLNAFNKILGVVFIIAGAIILSKIST